MELPQTSRELGGSEQPLVRVPRRLLLLCLAVALLTPYLARLPGVVSHGLDWLFSYVPSLGGALFVAAPSLVPASVLYLIGKLSKRAPLAFWGAVAASTGFALWAHGSMNLAASSTAAIGLLFIPIYSAGFAIAGAIIGFIIQKIVPPESVRRLIAWTACIGAVLVSLGSVLQNQAENVERESRFPGVSVNKLPLVERTIFACCEVGRVEALAFGNFDPAPGQEVALLAGDFNVVLDADTYAVRSKTKMAKLDCDHCVGMYSRIVPAGKDSFVVASSDGVVDRTGQILWRLDHSSFAKIVALQLPGDGEPTFFSAEIPSLVERHDAQGTVLWRFEGDVSDIGIFEQPDGARLPVATMTGGKSPEWGVFSLDGKVQQKIALPRWADEVSSVAWPSRGHILAGSGSWIGVLDAEGKEVLLHQIQSTSFKPYHGPEGVAVRFSPTEKPYLAVMSHGSSGYARSVLLIFDPEGRLVRQEELNKLRAMLAVPRVDGNGDVLLVGGMDGILEYSLAAPSAPMPNR